ncbi:MAG: patatin family protein [Pseudobutyrivibrio sp.]|nr:patatin family protein [Pseudobutyrivibrio sp.]
MSKIGLIVEGGGMKCAYSAGVLDAFIDNNINFDYCIGVSAGSANAASFIAGQKGRNRRFYTDHIKEPGYFGLKSYLKCHNLFGLQYIYGTLSNSDGADALDYKHLIMNRTEFLIVATDAETGEARYFHKEEMPKDDYRVIMASSALPGACLPVEIDGRYYCDGGVADSIPIQKALDDGCDKVIVIMSKTRDFVKKPESLRGFYSFKCRKFPKIIEKLNHRHIDYTKSQKLTYELEAQGKVMVFAPSQPMNMGTFTMDAKANEELYELGIKDFNSVKNKFFEFMELPYEESISNSRIDKEQMQENLAAN